MTPFVLENGLTVSLQESRNVPLVTLDMWVRVGSGDEPSHLAGVSHFLEHMLFKGTERLDVGEYDDRVESVGGYLNAATSTDYTHYYVTAPSEHFSSVLEDFADVILNSTLDGGEVERERLVILEEIRRKRDTPFGYLLEAITDELYVSGPVKHTVLGSSESVAALTRDQLHEHYHRHYAPANMYLSVVGDVDRVEALDAVKLAFGGASRKFRPWEDAAKVTNHAPPSARHLPNAWNEAYFVLAWPGREARTVREVVLADFAEALLAGGRSSRLRNRLQEKLGIVSSIGCYLPTARFASSLLVYGTCQPGNAVRSREEVLNVLRTLDTEGLKSGELARIRKIVTNSHLFSLETNSGRSATFGHSQVLLGSGALYEEYLKEIGEVTGDQLLDYVREAFEPARASFFVTCREDVPLD